MEIELKDKSTEILLIFLAVALILLGVRETVGETLYSSLYSDVAQSLTRLGVLALMALLLYLITKYMPPPSPATTVGVPPAPPAPPPAPTSTGEEKIPGGAVPTVPKTIEKPPTPPTLTTPPTSETSIMMGIDITQCPMDWAPTSMNTLKFTARIYRCENGVWVYPGRPRKIVFTLENVSNERGVCMNHGQSLNPDLWFPEEFIMNYRYFELLDDKTVDDKCNDPNHNSPLGHKHWATAVTKNEVTEATIRVRAEDFGAWGWIKAAAEGCVGIPPRESVNAPVASGSCVTGKPIVKIPYDLNKNNIPDGDKFKMWDSVYGEEPTTDMDRYPVGDGTMGDGLTNYEEYRGFMVKSGYDPAPMQDGIFGTEQHVRTDPGVKDLFIRRESDGTLPVTLFIGASGLAVHFIRAEGYNGDHTGNLSFGMPTVAKYAGPREVNYNRGFANGGVQHGIWLRWENITSDDPFMGTAGEAVGGVAPPVGKTAEDRRARININYAAVWLGEEVISQNLYKVIAHELGHCVNIAHHGEGPGRMGYHIHHGDPSKGEPANLIVYTKGCQTSGIMDCLMRYPTGYGWDDGDGYKEVPVYSKRLQDRGLVMLVPNSAIHPYKQPPPGQNIFCTSTAGDGDNSAPPDINNATKGKCKRQIRVKDW